MANDPRDLNGQKLSAALLNLGRDIQLRQELVQWLKKAEQRIGYEGSVRDDITGPIIDALHCDSDVYEKSLADGAKFQFFYRTKIARDFLLATSEVPTHVWEPQTTRLLKFLAAHGASDVLVGGAYFGDHAVLLGRQLSGSGRNVHCFEPNRAQAGMLSSNVALNGLDNLLIRKDGLWNEGSQKLRLDGFDSFANVVQVGATEEGFETVTIDEYCADQSCHLSLIMLDIEGAELRALQGATQTLRQDRPSIVFEVHRDYVDWSEGLLKTPICLLLSALGYHIFAVRDFNTNQEMGMLPIELIPADQVYLEGPAHGFNMLAVLDETILDRSLFRRVENVSPKLLRHKNPALHHPFDGMPDR